MRILCRPNEDFEGLSGAMDPIMRVGPDVAATAGTGQPRRQAVVRLYNLLTCYKNYLI